jgi:myosin heavy subunit
MSTLSKVFVILVTLVALVKLGMDVTLFAQRVDWKDKFVKEVNYHYQTQMIKNAEIADLHLQVENMRTYNDILTSKIQMLDVELAGKSARIAELARQFDLVDTNFKKLIADVDVYVRQLEVQITQIQEMNAKVEEYRQKLIRANNNANTSMQELQYARQEAERLQKDLASLEENHVSQARAKKHLEEILAMLEARGVQVSGAAPLKHLEGKVTAVSKDIGLVIISVGKDDGVLEGNEFTVYRGNEFITKIVINRVDRKWAAGRVVLPPRGDGVRVSDDVSNSIFVSTTNK